MLTRLLPRSLFAAARPDFTRVCTGGRVVARVQPILPCGVASCAAEKRTKRAADPVNVSVHPRRANRSRQHFAQPRLPSTLRHAPRHR